MKPKILLVDLETTPILGYSYKTYDTDLIHIVKDWYIYAWSAKWYGEKKTIFYGVGKAKNDKKIMAPLYKLIKEADIIMAHNGDRFDIKKIKTRFAYHGFPPFPPKLSIDTLKILRKEFGLSSNTLDYACRFFGLKRKKPSDQKDWLLKMEAGDKKVWRKIKEYNIQDVVILEELYDKIRPWIQNHPNMSILEDMNGCPNCGSQHLKKEGFNLTKAGRRQQYSCRNCGAWSSGKLIRKEKSE